MGFFDSSNPLADLIKRSAQKTATDYIQGLPEYAKAVQFKASSDMDKNLKKFLERQGKFAERQREGFKTNLALSKGQALGGLMRNVGQAASRTGTLFSGASQQANIEAQAQLATAGTMAMAGFEQEMARVMQANYDSFLQGEFSFIHQLQLQTMSQQFQERIARIRAQIAADQNSALSLSNLFQLGGYALAAWNPFAGIAVNAATNTGNLRRQGVGN